MPEQAIYRTKEQDRAEFANAFPDKAGAINAQIEGKRITSRSESEQALLDSVYEMHDLMRRIGVQPATVVNLWPVPLHSSGPQVEHLNVPACPIGQEFVTFVIESYGTDVVDRGGRYDVKPVLPIDLAKDILQQKMKSNTLIQHGVVIYMGDHKPNERNLAEINESRKKMVKHMKKLVEDANGQWVRGGRNSNIITDPIRYAAEYLLHHRFLTKKPEWMITARNQEDIIPECPSCGTEPARAAFSCRQCGWVLKPDVAYELGAVSASTPDGVRALARLSRERLKELGISELIEQTVDERKAAERGEAKGKGKKTT